MYYFFKHFSKLFPRTAKSSDRRDDLTADKAKQLLDGMPAKLRRKVATLSQDTGLSVQIILERAVDLYRKQSKTVPMSASGAGPLDELLKKPGWKARYQTLMAAIGAQTAHRMTEQQRRERAAAGGAAAAGKLTKDELKKKMSELSRKAAQARKKPT